MKNKDYYSMTIPKLTNLFHQISKFIFNLTPIYVPMVKRDCPKVNQMTFGTASLIPFSTHFSPGCSNTST